MKKDFLHPLPKDERDIKLGLVVRLPELSELPDNFEHDPLDIKDQINSDFCVGFSTCGASQLQEDDILVPEYQFALIKELMGGDVDSFGADLRVGMKSHQKIGALSEKYRPQGYTLTEKGSEFLRRIENWAPELKEKAIEHKKKAYVDVTGQYDYFDDIRAAIWLFKEEKRVPVFGVRWSWSLQNPYLEKPNDGEGHAVYACGWRTINGKQYLVIPNSYGTQVGDNGKFYMSREVVNAFVSIFGAFMFIDYTPDELRKIIEDKKINPILQAIINIIKKILDIDQEIINKNVLVKPIVESPVVSVIQPVDQPVIQPVKTKMPTIKDFALAIQHHEGYFKPGENGYPDGSLSYRNANPGNLRPTKYVIDYLGALGEGVGGFARFSSYEKGFEGLCMFIKNCQNNMVRGYHDATIKSFFERYAPSEDNNNPLAYAKAVAKRLGVSIDFKIKDLV